MKYFSEPQQSDACLSQDFKQSSLRLEGLSRVLGLIQSRSQYFGFISFIHFGVYIQPGIFTDVITFVCAPALCLAILQGVRKSSLTWFDFMTKAKAKRDRNLDVP